jgi:hypothetical protein
LELVCTKYEIESTLLLVLKGLGSKGTQDISNRDGSLESEPSLARRTGFLDAEPYCRFSIPLAYRNGFLFGLYRKVARFSAIALNA